LVVSRAVFPQQVAVVATSEEAHINAVVAAGTNTKEVAVAAEASIWAEAEDQAVAVADTNSVEAAEDQVVEWEAVAVDLWVEAAEDQVVE
jgi:hypothetical protein